MKPMEAGLRMVRAALIPVLVAACAAGPAVQVETDPDRTYALEVRNTRPHPMIVSYDDGSGVRLLGTVGGDQTEHFVIAGARGPDITVIAVDTDRTRTVRREVRLRPGGTAYVRLEE